MRTKRLVREEGRIGACIHHHRPALLCNSSRGGRQASKANNLGGVCSRALNGHCSILSESRQLNMKCPCVCVCVCVRSEGNSPMFLEENNTTKQKNTPLAFIVHSVSANVQSGSLRPAAAVVAPARKPPPSLTGENAIIATIVSPRLCPDDKQKQGLIPPRAGKSCKCTGRGKLYKN